MGRDDRNLCTYFKVETDVDQNLINDVFLIRQIFFNNIIHGYRAAALKKSSLWLLLFFMAVATY